MKSRKTNILVVGDLMIDHYLWGKTDRISPEAPVQVIDIQKETTVLGGAGNVVNNLISLDCDVTVASVIGRDDNSRFLVNLLNDIGTTNFLVFDENRKTTKKSRIIASSQQIVRYDHETKQEISSNNEEELIKNIEKSIDQFDIILLSDYGKGVLTNTLSQNIISVGNSKNIKVLVDPKGIDYTKYSGAYLLTPNKKEAQLATNININDNNLLKASLNKLKEIANLTISLITLSDDGIAILNENGEFIKKPTVAKEVFDVTGAGDTVLASLGYALANNFDINRALEFANIAAGVVVAKIGSATASFEEIEEYQSSLHKSSIESHIKTFDEIKRVVKYLKNQNKKIVFTNGCFDILHKGHVYYLDRAKSFGDILILGLNSDSSVQKLKGPSRPINSEDDRAYILAALESVDYIVKFTQETPYELIKIIEPDILVKGGDYKGKNVVGKDIVKEVKLVEFVDGRSTTNIIKKIECCGE